MKVLFVSSEMFPYSKSGGLGDVAHSLPLALQKYCEVVTLTPLYRFVDRKPLQLHPIGAAHTLKAGGKTYTYSIMWEEKHGTLFIENDLLCQSDVLYGMENDALRFGLFSHIAADVAKRIEADIVHLNDWHTALTPLFLKKSRIPTVFTIHNLAYQGIFGKEVLQPLGIEKRYFTMEGVEFFGKVNFMKAGIAYSDTVTTVSPTYAKEILTPEFGCGLDGFLKKHSQKLIGILNGIDTRFFDPAHDNALALNYTAAHPEVKAENKKALFGKLTLTDWEQPLFVFIGRLVEQKGLSLIRGMLEKLSGETLTFIMLGEGDAETEAEFRKLSKRYLHFHYIQGYDEALSHQLYAAADFLLMPSRFEPCGLNQMIAARYGAIPIVHSTGGLKDSVFEAHKQCIEGIVFEDYSVQALLHAVQRAMHRYADRAAFLQTVQFDMQCDVSFDKSAKTYAALYRKML